MARLSWGVANARKVRKRIVVEGELVLDEPVHLGGGSEEDASVDMRLLVDEVDGKPLLTGASIAGALRSYLRARELGYEQGHDTGITVQQDLNSLATLLFGGRKGDDDGVQSPLVVEDALGNLATTRSVRDGVALDPATRTAEEGALYNFEVWDAGVVFPLRFELAICDAGPAANREDDLHCALLTIMAGLSDGEILIGAKKNRGYGKGRVHAWHVETYDFATADGLTRWIESGQNAPVHQQSIEELESDWNVTPVGDARHYFDIDATFLLKDSLLIRAGDDRPGPDMVHLMTRFVDGTRQPVIPGTSFAGTVKNRCVKIAAIHTGNHAAQLHNRLMKSLFGDVEQGRSDEAMGSRVQIRQTLIPSESVVTDLVQHRICIDRFTGGVLPGALFNQQPIFASDDSFVTLDIRIINPLDAEIGLLLHALRDLWTTDLPVGGEASVGRGRLTGQKAALVHNKPGETTRWVLHTAADPAQPLGLSEAELESLNVYAEKLEALEENDLKAEVLHG